MLNNPKVVNFLRITTPVLCMVIGWFVVTLWDEKEAQLQKVELAAYEFNQIKNGFVTKEDLHLLALKVEKNSLLVERLNIKVDTLITYIQNLKNGTPTSQGVQYAEEGEEQKRKSN